MFKKIAFTLILVFSLFLTREVFATEWIPMTPVEIQFFPGDEYMSEGYMPTWPSTLTLANQYSLTCPQKLYSSEGHAFDTNEIPGFPSNVYNPEAPDNWYDPYFDNPAHGNTNNCANWNSSPAMGTYFDSMSAYDYNQKYVLRLVWFKDQDIAFYGFVYYDWSAPSGSRVISPQINNPLISGIDKISLYTLNNEDLDTITTPIPFDAGHNILFFNYEEDPYRYLAFNMTICHNGQLEGCTANNETYVEDYFDISSLGFSSSGSSPLSFKLNFKDVVSQSDLVNITWFLTNCPDTSASCPSGVSDGRGYTYLINNSLSSDSWLTFDDPARPECSIARLDVCLINAVNYFIKPRSSGFANSFSVASTRINERVPFIYLYAVRDAFTEIFNSTPATVNWSVSFGSLGSLTVLDSDSFSGSPYYSFFTGMRVYLGYLLWILLGVGLYKRAIRLFDDKTVA